jgi:hypothetical protein
MDNCPRKLQGPEFIEFLFIVKKRQQVPKTKVVVRLVSKLKDFEVDEKINKVELQKNVDDEVGDNIVTGLQKFNECKWEYDILDLI